MTVESSLPQAGHPGDPSPPAPAADDHPVHEVIYAQTMARFAAMYDEWSTTVDTVLGGGSMPRPVPTHAE
jgi:hypothetical protein